MVRPRSVSKKIQWPFCTAVQLLNSCLLLSQWKYPTGAGYIRVQRGGFWKPWFWTNFITQVWLKVKISKQMQTLHLSLNILIWIPGSALLTPTVPSRCSQTEKKTCQCQATPSAPAQDAPAYKKAPATSRRVNRGRHLGDSPTERVSPWKWCQQKSVVVERPLCWCLWNVPGDIPVMKAQGRQSTAQSRTVLIRGIKQSLPLSVFSLRVEWSEWHCPAECSLCLNPAFYQWHHSAFTQRGFQN